jgi:hypothetical protein
MIGLLFTRRTKSETIKPGILRRYDPSTMDGKLFVNPIDPSCDTASTTLSLEFWESMVQPTGKERSFQAKVSFTPDPDLE